MTSNNKKPKFSFTWIYMIIGGILLYMYFFGENDKGQIVEKPYTVVEECIKKGWVKDITVVNKSKIGFFPDK